MNRAGSPSSFVPGRLLLLACLGTGDEAFSLPSDSTNELFAIRSQGTRGVGFWEFQYGLLDQGTLEFKERRIWRYDRGFMEVGAVDPVGGRFFVIGGIGSIIVVDAVAAAAQERAFRGLLVLP